MRQKLTELCDILYGFAFDSAGFTEDSTYPPLVRIRDVKRGYSETNYSGDYQEQYVIHAGDLLIGMDGEFNIARWKSRDALLNQRVCKISAKEGTEEEYLRFALSRALREIENRTAFVTVKHLSAKELNKLELQVPSLSEQNRIAITLRRIEQLIDLRNEELKKYDELIRARFVELFGDPVSNPMGHLKLTVKDAVNKGYIDRPLDGNHGEKHPKATEYVESGVPFVMANNLINGTVDYENCSKITRERADRLDKGFAHDGDLLITHKGTIGRTAIVHTKLDYIMLTPQVTYYRPLKGIIAEYLKGYFDTDYYQGELKKLAAAGGSTRAYIGITKQTQLQLVIPSLNLQKQFAAFVDQVDKSKCDTSNITSATQYQLAS